MATPDQTAGNKGITGPSDGDDRAGFWNSLSRLNNSLATTSDAASHAIAMRKTDKDGWEKSRVIATWIAAIVIPLVLGFSGHAMNLAIKERETSVQMVELAVDLLREYPRETGEDRELRSWALNVIEKYSSVQLPDEAREYLRATALKVGGMSTTYLESDYDVANEDIKLTVVVGDAQIGTSVVRLGSAEIGRGDIKDLLIGSGPSVSGGQLSVKSVVTDVNDRTNHTSITYILEGGAARQSFVSSGTVDQNGGSIVYRATFNLVN